ncbi:hypothetical protein A3Q56_03862 [Intoshia linei]|uniref:Uncharacterized protein n=1 Tax=Intoshia linei TaxID=1819745 RepID=A0A177B291_9BILA|nr:hypothetical protein A3Q56_03862 [Intoshia linei]
MFNPFIYNSKLKGKLKKDKSLTNLVRSKQQKLLLVQIYGNKLIDIFEKTEKDTFSEINEILIKYDNIGMEKIKYRAENTKNHLNYEIKNLKCKLQNGTNKIENEIQIVNNHVENVIKHGNNLINYRNEVYPVKLEKIKSLTLKLTLYEKEYLKSHPKLLKDVGSGWELFNKHLNSKRNHIIYNSVENMVNKIPQYVVEISKENKHLEKRISEKIEENESLKQEILRIEKENFKLKQYCKTYKNELEQLFTNVNSKKNDTNANDDISFFYNDNLLI